MLPWQQDSWGQLGAHLGRQDSGGPNVGHTNLDIWVPSTNYHRSDRWTSAFLLATVNTGVCEINIHGWYQSVDINFLQFAHARPINEDNVTILVLAQSRPVCNHSYKHTHAYHNQECLTMKFFITMCLRLQMCLITAANVPLINWFKEYKSKNDNMHGNKNIHLSWNHIITEIIGLHVYICILSLSLSLSLYIYIYIYVCVYVCVYVYTAAQKFPFRQPMKMCQR